MQCEAIVYVGHKCIFMASFLKLTTTKYDEKKWNEGEKFHWRKEFYKIARFIAWVQFQPFTFQSIACDYLMLKRVVNRTRCLQLTFPEILISRYCEMVNAWKVSALYFFFFNLSVSLFLPIELNVIRCHFLEHSHAANAPFHFMVIQCIHLVKQEPYIFCNLNTTSK